MACRVLRFIYSDGGSFMAYRAFMLMYIVMEGHLWHIGCSCSYRVFMFMHSD